MGYFNPKLQLVINNVVIAGWTTANANIEVVYDSGNTVATIETLNIRGGRMDVTAQPTAMQCSIDVVTSTSIADVDSKIGANMVVNVYNSHTATWTPLFTGIMSDKTVAINSWSNGDGLYLYSFSGYTRMASLQLSRQSYASGSTVLHSAASASERINEVIGGWQYAPTWIGAINTDSVILHRRNGGAAAKYFDYDVIESAATSGRGCFHDRSDGKVYYNSYAQTLQASLGTIYESHVSATALNATRSVTDIYTVCIVESTNQALTDAQNSSTGGQIGLYGKRFGFRSTECQSQIEIDNQATAFLISRQNPRWRPSAITVDLGVIDVAVTAQAEWLAKFFGVRTNSRMSIPFPAPLGGTTDCLLDNWNWSFSRGRMFLEMQLSNVLDTHGSDEL